MGRKILALLGTLGILSPLLLQSLAIVIVVITLSVIVIVFIALFNQKVLNRLIKLIAAIPSLWK